MTLDEIQTRLDGLLDRCALTLVRPVAIEGFSSEQFIWSICVTRPAEPPSASFEALVKKIEVSRRLCVQYDANIAKTIDETPIRSEFVEAFAVALLHYGVRRKEWKWVNTVLKLHWGILREPEFTLSPELAELAHAFVDIDL